MTVGDAARAQPAHELDAVALGGDSEHAKPEDLGELHGDVAESPARAEDDDIVAGLVLELFEALHRRDPGHRERAGLLDRDPVRHGREVTRLDRRVLGEESALGVAESPPVDAVADRELLDATA